MSSLVGLLSFGAIALVLLALMILMLLFTDGFVELRKRIFGAEHTGMVSGRANVRVSAVAVGILALAALGGVFYYAERL